MADDNIIIQSELRLDVQKAEEKIKSLERQLSEALKTRRDSGSTPLLDIRIKSLKKNLDEAKKSASSARAELRSFTTEGTEGLSTMERVAGGLAGTMATVFSVKAAKEFLSQVISVRGEFQQLEIAFETLLGSKDKANKVLSGATELAAKTPFDLKGVASGARQLLAYGFEADKVIDVMRRLGDVAAGLGLPLERLTYLYGTTRVQGRLFTRDMLQFTNSGIPVLDELSKMYGKTTAQINEMVKAGKIGFADIEKVFTKMTDEGGKFANLMEKQSASITGRISNIQDAIDVMFNNIGKSAEGPIYKVLDVVGNLVENYETVGKVLGGVITAFGVSKAALMLYTASVRSAGMAEAGYTIALGKNTREQYKNVLAATNAKTAQQQLNKAILTNPYVLLGTAVAALTVGLIAYSRANNFALQSQKRLDKSIASAAAETTKEMTELNRLQAVMKNATKDSVEYNAAKNEAIKKYEQYIPNIKDEIEKVGDLSTVYETLTTKIKESVSARAYSSYMEKQEQETTKALEKQYDKLRVAIENQLGKGTLESQEAFFRIMRGLIDPEGITDELQKEIDSFAHSMSNSFTTSMQASDYYNAVQEIVDKIIEVKDQTDQANKAAREYFGLGAEKTELQKALENLDDVKLDNLLKEIQKVKDAVAEGPEGGFGSFVFNGHLYGYKQGRDEKGNKVAIPTNENGYHAEGDYIETTGKKQQEANKNKNKNKPGGDTSESTKAKQIRARQAEKKAQEALSKARLDAEAKAQKEEIDLMEEGLEKKMALIEYEKQERLRQIEEERKQYIDKLKELAKAEWKARNPESKGEWDEKSFKISPEQQAFIDKMYGKVGADGKLEGGQLNDTAGKAANKSYQRALDEQLKAYGDFNAKRASIVKEWNDKIAEAEKALTRVTGEEDKKRLQSSIDSMKRKKDIELAEEDYNLVSQYGGTNQQRSALERLWQARIADAAPGMKDAMQRKMDEELSQLDVDAFKAQIDWDVVFGDMGQQATASLSRNMAQVKQWLDANRGTLNIDEIRDIEESLASMSDEIAGRNPFVAIRTSIDELKETKASLPDLVREYNEALASFSQAEEDYIAKKKAIDEELAAPGITDERKAELIQQQTIADGELDKAQQALIKSSRALHTAENKITSGGIKLINALNGVREGMRNGTAVVTEFVGVFDEDMANAIQEAVDLFTELGDIVSEIASKLVQEGTDMVKDLQETAEGTADAVKGTAEATSAAISAAEAASVVLLVIKAVIIALTAVFRIVKANEEAEKKSAEAAREYAQALREIADAANKAKFANIFGSDTLGRFRQATQLIKEIHNELKKTISDAQDKAMWMLPPDWKAQIKRASGDFAYSLTADMRSGWQKFWGTGSKNIMSKNLQDFIDKDGNIMTDALKAWYDQYGDYLSDTDKQLVDELLSQGERFEQAMDDIKSYLEGVFGDTADSIADKMISAFEETGDAAADFGDLMDDVAKKMAKSWVIDKIIGSVFNKEAEQRMSDLLAANNVSGAVEYYNSLIEKANESAPAINEFLRGLDVNWSKEDENERQASTRSSLGASQDSIDESNARLTTIQAHTYMLTVDVDAIRTQNEMLTAQSAAMLEHVQGIHINTNEMRAMMDDLRVMAGSIRSNVSTIVDRGVKMQ